MKFEFVEAPKLKDIKSKDSDSGRVYEVDQNKYPSITTVLSILSKEDIEKWRKRVGENEANYVSKFASTSGTELHRLCEDFVAGKEVKTKCYRSLDLFLQIKRELINHLGKVYYQEAGLYSDVIKIAGRTDLIAEWDNELSIIDYKTSKRMKNLDDIESYFIQACFYSLALQEQTGLIAKKLVIVIGNDQSSYASVFIQDRKDYIKRLVEVKKQYDISKGS